MSVFGTATVLLRTDLVQVTDLDPKQLVVMQGSVAGDGGGGSSDVTAAIPTGFGAMIMRASGNISATTTATNMLFRIRLDGDAVEEFATGPFNVAGAQRYGSFRPTKMLWTNNLIELIAICDNVNAQTQTLECTMLLWDLQTARNLPQRFFWPGLLG